jgi:hypothetical protein
MLGGVTEIVVLAEVPRLVALIVALPVATPVANPVEETVAMAGLDETHVIGCLDSAVPVESFGVAVSCLVAPTSTDAEVGESTTLVTGTAGKVKVNAT